MRVFDWEMGEMAAVESPVYYHDDDDEILYSCFLYRITSFTHPFFRCIKLYPVLLQLIPILIKHLLFSPFSFLQTVFLATSYCSHVHFGHCF